MRLHTAELKVVAEPDCVPDNAGPVLPTSRVFAETLAASTSVPDEETVMQAVQDDPLIGASVGSYRIARQLGRGGMGAVYLGEHPLIGSRVAIKFLHDS